VIRVAHEAVAEDALVLMSVRGCLACEDLIIDALLVLVLHEMIEA
jgi:hypothetical protein